MDKLDFWKDREKRILDPSLFSVKAESLAKELADDCEKSRKRLNKRTQIRKFYDEIVRLNMEARSRENEWENILPLVNMLTAKAAYARGRELISDNFLGFIRSSIGQIQDPEDLAVFTNLFESFYGFYRLYCPVN